MQEKVLQNPPELERSQKVQFTEEQPQRTGALHGADENPEAKALKRCLRAA